MSENIITQPPATEGGDAKEQAKADYKTGQDFLVKGDTALAAHAFHNAMLGFQECNDLHGVANAADKLADICMDRQEFSQALKHIETAYEICEKEEDQQSTISLRQKIAAAKTGMKKYDEALEIYFDLIDHYRGSLNPKGTVETMEKVAEVYLQQGNTSGAADAYRTIASIHANFKHKKVAQEYNEKADKLDKK